MEFTDDELLMLAWGLRWGINEAQSNEVEEEKALLERINDELSR